MLVKTAGKVVSVRKSCYSVSVCHQGARFHGWSRFRSLPQGALLILQAHVVTLCTCKQRSVEEGTLTRPFNR